MHVLFIGQVFRGGQRHTGGGDALDGGVVGQVHKQHSALDGAGAPEVGDKEVGFLKGDADSAKNHGEFFVRAKHLGLAGNLGGQLGVGQTAAREHRQFLPAYQGVQAVNSGDARLDKLAGIVPGGGVQRLAVDVPAYLGDDGGAAVARFAHAVKHAAQHVHGQGQLNAPA